jgi:lysyl-tRNA synthetase class 2
MEGEGEEKKLSKNALKKQAKLEKNAAAKAEKEEKKRAEQPTKPKEEELDPTAYFENRSAYVQNLKTTGNAYPHKFQITATLPEYIA